MFFTLRVLRSDWFALPIFASHSAVYVGWAHRSVPGIGA